MCHQNESIPWSPQGQCGSQSKLTTQFDCEYLNKKCILEKMNDACITFNRNGTLKQIGDGAPLIIRMNSDKFNERMAYVFLSNNTINSTGIVIHGSYGQDLKPGNYDVLLKRRETSRLPLPYPSNCTSKASLYRKESARYSYDACMDNCIANAMLRKCQTTVDWWKHILKTNVNTSTNINATDTDTRQCLSDVVREVTVSAPADCDCPVACSQVDFKPTFLKMADWENPTDWQWKFTFSFESKEIMFVKETALYSSAEIYSYIGGILGLMNGASVFSLFEIFVCFCLWIVACLTRR